MSRTMFDRLVLFLGGALIIDLLGIIVLLGFDKGVDDILKLTLTGLVTGLLGLMVRAPASSDDEPQPVQIVNAGPAEAVPVEPTPLPARKTAKKR